MGLDRAPLLISAGLDLLLSKGELKGLEQASDAYLGLGGLDLSEYWAVCESHSVLVQVVEKRKENNFGEILDPK